MVKVADELARNILQGPPPGAGCPSLSHHSSLYLTVEKYCSHEYWMKVRVSYENIQSICFLYFHSSVPSQEFPSKERERQSSTFRCSALALCTFKRLQWKCRHQKAPFFYFIWETFLIRHNFKLYI